VLSGDLGNDVLSGGAGADVFRFAANDAALISVDALLGQYERVTDYADGVDRIDLVFEVAGIVDGGSYATLSAALVAVTGLLGGNAGKGATVEVGSDCFLFYNGAGGSIVDSLVKLDGVDASAISVSDFI
jgi:serralysin